MTEQKIIWRWQTKRYIRDGWLVWPHPHKWWLSVAYSIEIQVAKCKLSASDFDARFDARDEAYREKVQRTSEAWRN
jgi:hypothetical protein